MAHPNMEGIVEEVDEEFESGEEEEEDEDEYETDDEEAEDGRIVEVDEEVAQAAAGQPVWDGGGFGALGLPGLGGQRGGAGARGPGQAGGAGKGGASVLNREWQGLAQLPEPTRQAFNEVLQSLKNVRKTSATVLVLGKGGVGKSSTVNSIVNEGSIAPPAPLRPGGLTSARTFTRTAVGFRLTLIDTPALIELDSANLEALGAVRDELAKADTEVDAVLYVDRLDSYRTTSADAQAIEAVSQVLGPAVWDKAILTFTHTRPAVLIFPGTYEDFVEGRARELRGAIRRHGRAAGAAPLPLALVENSSRAPQDAHRQKLVGDEPRQRPWLPALMQEVGAMALRSPPWRFSAAQAKRQHPDRRRLWLIPLLLAAQVALKVFVVDPILEDDAAWGDAKGPFPPDVVERARERQRAQKEKDRRAAEFERASRKARSQGTARGAGPSSRASQRARAMYVDEEEEADLEDEE